MNMKPLIGALAYAGLMVALIVFVACGGGSNDEQTIDSDGVPETPNNVEITPIETEQEIKQEGSASETAMPESNTSDDLSIVDEDINMDTIPEADPSNLSGTPTPGPGPPTAAPGEFATATPLATPTIIGTPTSTPIPAATATAFATPTVVGEGTPTPFPTPTEVVQATATPTPGGTATPFATPTPYEEPTPAGTATPFATATPFVTPTPISK